jgi:hypothetical protein
MTRLAVQATMWICLGALTSVVLDYYLYRVGLPIKPFIYQAF